MKDLIERLEKCTGPDRRIDALIWKLEPCEPPDCLANIRDKIVQRFLDGEQWDDEEVPRFTASLDAALTLVPEGWRWYVSDGDDQSNEDAVASVFRTDDIIKSGAVPRSVGATPAIALCIAALKARIAVERDLTKEASNG